uniref:uncharacterized protein LOC120342999 n=1 Tax=Styela clava TaxID=7725 RepID=UPI00193A9495|nr:uncharacterized protein LOC120342999 [Styela clava]XP_039267996.1 uncharacterized protein LOC120342999 [Styela clava]
MPKYKEAMSAQSRNGPKVGIDTSQTQTTSKTHSPSFSYLQQEQSTATNIQQHHGKNTKQYPLEPTYAVISPHGETIYVKGTKMGTERHKPASTSTPLRNDTDYGKKRTRQDLKILVSVIEGKVIHYDAADRSKLWAKCNQVECWLMNECTEMWNKLHKEWQTVEKRGL